MTSATQLRPAVWLNGAGTESGVVIASRGVLSRNLADFPFLERCTLEDKAHVEERVLKALETAGLLREGHYHPIASLDAVGSRVLLERQLFSEALLLGEGPRGVYMNHNQTLSVIINETDHVAINVMFSGLETDSVWARLVDLDDRFGQCMDFTFHERIGYLSPSIERVGTGLRMSVLLHLPALVGASTILGLEQRLREQRHILQSTYGSIDHCPGDFFVLSNQCTLGQSEEEISYHLRHIALEVVCQEREIRSAALLDGARIIEDRVGRALGIARHAQLLDFPEALGVLSSLRLGADVGILKGFALSGINELLVSCQRGHLEMRTGHSCDDATLNQERADFFRAQFS